MMSHFHVPGFPAEFHLQDRMLLVEDKATTKTLIVQMIASCKLYCVESGTDVNERAIKNISRACLVPIINIYKHARKIQNKDDHFPQQHFYNTPSTQ